MWRDEDMSEIGVDDVEFTKNQKVKNEDNNDCL